jgi:thymidine phosphorylase
MATFKSYAQGGGFKPIQAPDIASAVEARAKKQSNYMREAAKYNIDERQRIGNAIEINNDIEFRNRQQIFDFESRNLQAVQNQIMGNYEATISNAQAESKQQLATLNALSNFSQTAFQTVQAVNEKIETGS